MINLVWLLLLLPIGIAIFAYRVEKRRIDELVELIKSRSKTI
jgi:hypothetical protein